MVTIMGKTFRRDKSDLPKWMDDREDIHRDGSRTNRIDSGVKDAQNLKRRHEERQMKHQVRNGVIEGHFASDDYAKRESNKCFKFS